MNSVDVRQKLASLRARSVAALAAASASGATPVSPPPGAAEVPDQSILDQYVLEAPGAQNALDLFAGEWSSSFPPPLSHLRAGPVPLFEDDRITWALEQIGDVRGRRVVELGPLEGGHSYMLAKAGAEVYAIEAQTRAYLKCLIAKEVLGYSGAQFVLGDFLDYLRGTEDRFDICLASGVLYHMRNPVELVHLMTKVADRLVLWTHYYDRDIVAANDLLRPRFPSERQHSFAGFDHTLYQFRYESALQLKGFCGGNAPHSQWLSRQDLIGALDHFGWDVEAVAFEEPEHIHGPAIAMVAKRRTNGDTGSG